MPAPSQPVMRKFGDHDAVRGAILDNVREAVEKLPAAENTRYRLQISQPRYAGKGIFSLAEQKHALLAGRTLGNRLIGDVSLIDKATGNLVEKKTLALATVPWLTHQGTFVLDGNSIPVAHQLRLLPGVYVRKTQAGRSEGHVNTTPGQGVSHRITIDPETGVFKTKVGQAEIPTLPLLRALGATPEEIKKAWGDALYSRNLKSEKPHHLEKYWEKFGPPGPVPDGIDLHKALSERLAKYPLDPWVMSRTIGIPTSNYGKDVLLATTKKVLDVHRRQAQPDDRDHPAFASVYGPESLMAERVARSGPLLAKMLWAATNTGSLKRVTPGFLNASIKSLFTKSGLALSAEGTNAAEYIDHGARITKVGEGGIGRNADSVPMSSRDFSPGQYPFIDSIRTAESSAVGVDLRVAFGNRLGHDRKIYAPVIDRRTGKLVYKNPQDIYDATMAPPGVMNGPNSEVEVIRNGKLTYAPRHEVDYIVPSMEQSFSPLTNMVPLKSASKAHRPSMGSRMITQALPLAVPEAPYVRTQVPNQPGKSFEELYGRHMGPIYAAKQGGVVTAVNKDSVTVKYADGKTQTHEIYDNHPTGRKTALTSVPVVKPGDPVQPGQMLARSNYTDDKGHAAYGANLRTAYMFGKGSVYEDATVVSESAAKRLTSDHLYTHSIEPDEQTMISKAAHAAAFGGKHTLQVLKNIGEDGVVKPGTVLKYGDPVILAVRRKIGAFGRLSRSGRAGLSDVSQTWDHHEPGEVADVVHGADGPNVTVKTTKALQSGDKISGRHGNKGIAIVWPDHKMPHGEDGNPVDLILSSLGTISRSNPSAVLESVLGKIAEKTGKPYVVSDFDDQGDGRNIGSWVSNEARRHGVKFRENLTDPATGRQIPNVGVGRLYIMKLSHIAESKVKGRGLGGYDETGQPLRGQTGKAMRSSLGDTNALLSYGATKTIHDDHIGKGLANEEFWQNFIQGYPTARPNVSPAFDRFISELRAGGVDPIRKDNKYHLMPLTDKKINELSKGRVLRNAETLDFSKNGEPYPGGLFASELFGSTDSTGQWASIPLHTPMVNPIMEDGARRLLDLTENRYRDVIAGKHEIATGTGPKAIADALTQIDVPQELKRLRTIAGGTRKTARDEANRKIFYLKGLEKQNLKPADWLINSIPVLPPAFRPVRPGGPGGAAITSDANLLYSDAFNANESLASLAKKTHDTGAEHLNLYDSIKAVFGIGEPVSAKNKERGVKGVLGRLLGDSSKHSMMQQKLLGTPINLSGRATILPSPDLDMDEFGIPESLAWELYHPFVVRRMVRSGMTRVDAAEEVEKRGKVAKDHLLTEMSERPIRATRYPALHRGSTAGFRPVLVPGDAIQSNHMVNKAYGLDHDGNCVVFNTEIWVEFDPSVCYINLDVFDKTTIEDWYMRLVESETVYLHDGKAYSRIEIGRLPRLGTPVKDRNGADVYDLPPGFAICTYDHAIGAVKYSPMTMLTVEQGAECVLVETRHGYKVEVSDNESLAVFCRETGDLVKIRPKDAIGAMVPRLNRLPNTGTESSFDEGWWYGVLVSDGWVGSRMVGYAKNDMLRRAEFVRIAVDLFGAESFNLHEYSDEVAPGKNKFSNSTKLHLNGVALARQVYGIYAPGDHEGRAALTKQMPIEILERGSFDALMGLFSGLLDGDKTICWNTTYKNKRFVCRFCTSSPYLRDDLVRLGLRLGVRMSIGTNPATAAHAESYVITPSVPDLYRIGHGIKLVDKSAAAALDEFLSGDPPRDHHDLLPITPELAKVIRKACLPDRMTDYTKVSDAIRSGYVTRALAEKCIDLSVTHPHFERFVSTTRARDVSWERVTSITPTGKQEVFDVTVPATKVFAVGNGLVIYDTMTVSVPLSEDAVKETYEKLLPSKNLVSPQTMKPTNYLMNMEYGAGVYQSSTANNNNQPVPFANSKDAIKAYKSGNASMGMGTQVVVPGS